MRKGKRLALVSTMCAVVGVSTAVGFAGSDAFDWTLASVFGTGLGTTLLALATFWLADSTRADVRASTRLVELAESERRERPSPALDVDSDKRYGRVEGKGIPYVRLIAGNEKGRRASRGTQVMVDGYIPFTGGGTATAEEYVSLGSPSLGWTGMIGGDGDQATIFSGAVRPIDLGLLLPVAPRDAWTEGPEPLEIVDGGEWHLKLALAGNLSLVDNRDWLAPRSDGWVIGLILGADEAAARLYNVLINWEGRAASAEEALHSVEVDLWAWPYHRGGQRHPEVSSVFDLVRS